MRTVLQGRSERPARLYLMSAVGTAVVVGLLVGIWIGWGMR